MSYDSVEISEQDGDIQELYRFAGAGIDLRQTSSGVEVDLGGDEVYEPTAIERSGVVQESDHESMATLEVRVSPDHLVAVALRSVVPYEPITIRITRKHRSDAETEGAWLGFVRSASLEEGGDRAVLHCEPIPTSMAREGLRPVYSRTCPWSLYGPRCLAAVASFTLTGTVSAASGLTVSAAAFDAQPDGWLNGGACIVGFDRRLIVAHVGPMVTLLSAFASVGVGSAISATAGCSRLFTVCNSKFANINHFGGFPWLPDKNPFRVGLDG